MQGSGKHVHNCIDITESNAQFDGARPSGSGDPVGTVRVIGPQGEAVLREPVSEVLRFGSSSDEHQVRSQDHLWIFAELQDVADVPENSRAR